jgi:hypothetical protein
MSGIFSIVSHCTLQYFPVFAAHEQFGCAHFFTFSVAIRLSFTQFPERVRCGSLFEETIREFPAPVCSK